MRILIVESGFHLRSKYEKSLKSIGCKVSHLHQITGNEDLISKSKPDVVLWNHDSALFFEKIESIREIENMRNAHLMVSSNSSEEGWIATAYDNGVDDCFIQNHETDFLIKKVKTLIRKARPDNFKKEGVTLDTRALTIKFKESEIRLTKTPFNILSELLHTYPDMSIRDDLIRKSLKGAVMTKRILDVHICALRKILKKINIDIICLRSIGYRLQLDERPHQESKFFDQWENQLKKKILIAEDNDILRSTLRGALQNDYTIVEAPNGLIAREIMQLEKIDLVISDIQMPFFTGIDLLKWSKDNQKIPVILMTGFSQALETQSAADQGAAGFLAKPFREDELFKMLKEVFNEPEPEVITEDIDDQFCKISIEDFLSEKETEHDVYIRITNSKYIKISHKGGKLSNERILLYKEKGVQNIYIRKEDFARIVGFNLALAKVIKISPLNKEKKIRFLSATSNLIMENAFVNGVDKKAFMDTKSFLETSLGVFTEDEHVFSILDVLATSNNYLYAHSLGVSAFSVMIGRALNWNSAPILFRLAGGGLFHDIGKKELQKDILEKPRAIQTSQERTLIESHPTRGRDILETLKAIPSEVAIIAYQHHEDCTGQGFPLGIGKLKIHPLTKVVSVANIFCEYTINQNADSNVLTAKEALQKMETVKLEMMDKEAFAALKTLFK